MNLETKVKKSLEDLTRLHPEALASAMVSNAFDKIHSLYLAELGRIIPKKQKHPKGYEQEEDYLTQIKIGWNQCLENIDSNLKELRKKVNA